MNLEEEFTYLVTKHLESLNRQFEDELSSVLNQPYPNEVKSLQIEYESPTFSDEFSVCMFALDKEGNLVGDAYWFLKNKAVVVPSEIYESDKYNTIDTWATASSLLESWLVKRWGKVGNRNYPTYLAHHDSYFRRNMDNGTVTNIDMVVDRDNC